MRLTQQTGLTLISLKTPISPRDNRTRQIINLHQRPTSFWRNFCNYSSKQGPFKLLGITVLLFLLDQLFLIALFLF